MIEISLRMGLTGVNLSIGISGYHQNDFNDCQNTLILLLTKLDKQ